MGIDLKPWVDRWSRAQNYSQVMTCIADLCRAVIADEAAKDAPAASGTEPDEPPQRAEGVPQWFTSLLRPCVPLASDEQLARHAKVLWPKFRAEIARRAAEKYADYANAVATRDELTTERDAALAEVERLKSLQQPEGWAVFALRQDDAKRIAELEARVAEQCKEIERLLKPTESIMAASAASFNKELWVVSYVNFLSERNAREAEKQRADAAEAAQGELREFCKTRIVSCNSTVVHPIERTPHLTDADLDAALAAYRKTKEPAK